LKSRVPLQFLAALSLVLAGCRDDETQSASDEPPPIEIKAALQPAQAMTILAQVDGQVRTLSVREGAKVAANEMLVQLANPAVERDAEVARTQLAYLESRRNRGTRPAPAPAPAAPRDNLEITAKILELRRDRLEKMRALRKSNDITARELEHAEIEYLAALRDYNNERRGSTIAPPPAPIDDRELRRIEEEKSAAEARFAAERRALLRITSPIAGVVTRVHVAPGQAVFPRDAIADVADTATIHVRGEVAPELLRFLRPGMSVDVKVLSVPPRTFADEIEYVLPVQGESRSAMIVVTIPNPDGSLQPNTQAMITLRSLK
jgi:multidrug efflux pump subunit AcrA (membrane-fusion protein)